MNKWRTANVAIVVATLAARLRYLWVPISSDESGYLAVGRAWAHGARLYQDIWIDRQEGLLGMFRMLTHLGVDSTFGVRLLAIAAGVLAAVSIASIGASLVGEGARLPCGVVAAVLLGVGQIEGFEANAELLSGAVGAAALAVVLRAVAERRRARWFALGGAIAGYALMTKQSAFDTLVVAVALLAWRWWRSHRAGAARQLGAYLGGVGVTVGAAALHGALTGWQRWWFSFAGYRLQYRSVFSNANWDALADTAGIVAPILGPAIAVVLVMFAFAHRPLGRRAAAMLATWLAVAALSFLLGGLYYRHYWMILVFPLATALGAMISRLPTPTTRAVALVAALAVPVVLSVDLARLPADRVGDVLGDHRWANDRRVGAWIRRHSQSRSDQVLVLCNGVGLYGNIDSDPPYPYLWRLHIIDIPGARTQLAATLAAPTRPRFAAVYNQLSACDSSGQTEAALRANYRLVERIGGVQIYERNG